MRGAVAIREDIRDLILDATEELLARYGYTKMTMEDLAREVGIGKGTIYLHFTSKEDVVLSRIDRVVDRAIQQMSAIASAPGDAAERLVEMLVARVLVRFDASRRYTQSMDAMFAAIRAGLLKHRERHFAREADVLKRHLEAGRKQHAFTFEDPAATAEALLLATNSLLPYSLNNRELGTRAAVEMRVRTIASLLMDGLRNRRAR